MHTPYDVQEPIGDKSAWLWPCVYRPVVRVVAFWLGVCTIASAVIAWIPVALDAIGKTVLGDGVPGAMVLIGAAATDMGNGAMDIPSVLFRHGVRMCDFSLRGVPLATNLRRGLSRCTERLNTVHLPHTRGDMTQWIYTSPCGIVAIVPDDGGTPRVCSAPRAGRPSLLPCVSTRGGKTRGSHHPNLPVTLSGSSFWHDDIELEFPRFQGCTTVRASSPIRPFIVSLAVFDTGVATVDILAAGVTRRYTTRVGTGVQRRSTTNYVVLGAYVVSDETTRETEADPGYDDIVGWRSTLPGTLSEVLGVPGSCGACPESPDVSLSRCGASSVAG